MLFEMRTPICYSAQRLCAKPLNVIRNLASNIFVAAKCTGKTCDFNMAVPHFSNVCLFHASIKVFFLYFL